MFGLPIFISVIQVILLLTVFRYDTPKALKQKKEMARLNELMGKIYDVAKVRERVEAIIVDDNAKSSSPSYSETLCSPKYKKATVIGILISFFQQISGINAIMFYSTRIFSKTGTPATLATSLVGVVNMVSTLASTLLLSKFGRRSLLWTFSFVMAAILICLGIVYSLDQNPSTSMGYFEVILVLAFVACFEFSMGPITWIYMCV